VVEAVQKRVSVIVPVYNGRDVLERSLAALSASDLPRSSWELVVVDDASRDDSVDVAQEWADTVLRLEGSPRGPAFARNHGSETAEAGILAFVDADVCVHPSTLRRLVEVLEADAGVCAVFGAYDQAPPAPGTISQYRNLLHHYVHAGNAGDADTFWAGCGAIRRSEFVRAGGFDAQRYPRPQIEDIALGYRLRALGGRVLLDPDIQATHLKRWTLRGMVRNDLFDRAIPWMHLLMEQQVIGRGSLNIRARERVLTALAALAPMSLLAAALTRSSAWLVVALVCLCAIVVANAALFRWLARIRGAAFALRAIPLHLMHYGLNAVAVAIAAGQRVLRRTGRASHARFSTAARREVQ
jgi:glycosyltransferase involved in cell wall biosynthesis